MSGVKFAEVDDFVAQFDAEPIANRAAAMFDQLVDVRGSGVAVVHDEVAMRRRDPRAADREVLEPGAIDQRARRPRYAVGHAIASRVGILEHATGARRIERLRPLSKRERFARGLAEPVWIARADAKRRR